MSKSQATISKLISYWLRHKPEEANIELDEFGWTTIESVVAALKANGIESSTTDIITLNDSFDKRRWKIDTATGKIKATHGHSVAIIQELEPQIPPKKLYHGTACKFLQSIMKTGLKSMQRRYVHLSETIEMAIEVGKRHGNPFVIEIETKKLLDNGWNFYKTEQNVWLTSDIPVQYLAFGSWDFNFDEETENGIIKELKKEICRSHILSKKKHKLRLIGTYGPTEDYLFEHTNNNEYYVVHLTWSGKKESSQWPATERFEDFDSWIRKRLIPDQEDWYV